MVENIVGEETGAFMVSFVQLMKGFWPNESKRLYCGEVQCCRKGRLKHRFLVGR